MGHDMKAQPRQGCAIFCEGYSASLVTMSGSMAGKRMTSGSHATAFFCAGVGVAAENASSKCRSNPATNSDFL